MSDTTEARTAVETHTGRFKWTISDVGMLPKDPKNRWIDSPPFTINGQPWALRLYPFFPDRDEPVNESEYIGAFVMYKGKGHADAKFVITCGELKQSSPLDHFPSAWTGGASLRGWRDFAKREPLVGKEIVFTALVKVRGALTTCLETLLTTVPPPLPAPTLVPDLKRLLDTGEGSDVLVKTTAEVFPVLGKDGVMPAEGGPACKNDNVSPSWRTQWHKQSDVKTAGPR